MDTTINSWHPFCNHFCSKDTKIRLVFLQKLWDANAVLGWKSLAPSMGLLGRRMEHERMTRHLRTHVKLKTTVFGVRRSSYEDSVMRTTRSLVMKPQPRTLSLAPPSLFFCFCLFLVSYLSSTIIEGRLVPTSQFGDRLNSTLMVVGHDDTTTLTRSPKTTAKPSCRSLPQRPAWSHILVPDLLGAKSVKTCPHHLSHLAELTLLHGPPLMPSSDQTCTPPWAVQVLDKEPNLSIAPLGFPWGAGVTNTGDTRSLPLRFAGSTVRLFDWAARLISQHTKHAAKPSQDSSPKKRLDTKLHRHFSRSILGSTPGLFLLGSCVSFVGAPVTGPTLGANIHHSLVLIRTVQSIAYAMITESGPAVGSEQRRHGHLARGYVRCIVRIHYPCKKRSALCRFRAVVLGCVILDPTCCDANVPSWMPVSGFLAAKTFNTVGHHPGLRDSWAILGIIIRNRSSRLLCEGYTTSRFAKSPWRRAKLTHLVLPRLWLFSVPIFALENRTSFIVHNASSSPDGQVRAQSALPELYVERKLSSPVAIYEVGTLKIGISTLQAFLWMWKTRGHPSVSFESKRLFAGKWHERWGSLILGTNNDRFHSTARPSYKDCIASQRRPQKKSFSCFLLIPLPEEFLALFQALTPDPLSFSRLQLILVTRRINVHIPNRPSRRIFLSIFSSFGVGWWQMAKASPAQTTKRPLPATKNREGLSPSGKKLMKTKVDSKLNAYAGTDTIWSAPQVSPQELLKWG
ncbi:hypothetical protein ACRALDRAFT_2022394 [Sodiomyces alcalophilus JCM 7366]|uniref:uncharacterized protein n=1 Tax=Sodiomyces alcalophilus JCM 7366 TaxID=591952 RepID=UPI0039B4B626